MTQHETITSEIEQLLEKTHNLRKNGGQHRFFDTLTFIKQSRYLAPYNALLVMQQRPDATFVLSEARWLREFGRIQKPDAHPLVILKNFGPVEFVYDIKDIADIERHPIPGYHPNLPTEEICRRLFPVDGDIRGIKGLFAEMLRTCRNQGLHFEESPLDIHQAGLVRLKEARFRLPITEIKLAGKFHNYIMQVNSTHPLEIRFASLVHELAHIFCGHLNEFNSADFKRKSTEEEEFEAEAVAYLFCYRHGFRPRSEQYLVQDLTEGRDPSIACFDAIIKAYNKIEALFQPEGMTDLPSEFEVSIGGYFGDSYCVRLTGDSLVYEKSSGDIYEPNKPDSVEIRPSAKAWSNFWTSCHKIGVWHWEDSYENFNVVDGTSWHATIKVQDRFISTGGSNAFPGDAEFPDCDDYPPPFKKFLNAIKRLVGDLPFE